MVASQMGLLAADHFSHLFSDYSLAVIVTVP